MQHLIATFVIIMDSSADKFPLAFNSINVSKLLSVKGFRMIPLKLNERLLEAD